MSLFNTPVLFTIFNRLDKTKKVFDVIKHRKPKYLFIAADGPRKWVDDDNEKCRQTREIADQVDWDCKLKTLFQEKNLGCGKAMVTAIDWFFTNVNMGIILEDDCLPHIEFFDYCEELLKYYENEERVMLISGDNFQKGKKIGDASYYFSAYSHVWGWASWKRVWQNFKYDVKSFNESELLNKISHKFATTKESEYWIRLFHKIKTMEEVDFWGYQLSFSIWDKDGLSVIPNTNLITNVGFDETATHTKVSENEAANIDSKPILPLKHPSSIVQNKEADSRYYKLFLDDTPSLKYRVRQLIKKILPEFITSFYRRKIKQ